MPTRFAMGAGAIVLALIFCVIRVAPAMAQVAPLPVPADLQNPMVDVVYVTPVNPAFAGISERLKERRVLERLRVFLAPLRLSRKITIIADQCGTVTRAYRPQGPVTICYELIEQIEKVASKADPATRERVLVGAFIQVAFHEVANAVFDILQVPVWGRAHDAADRLAAFIMVQFGEEVAFQTILGTADFFKLSGNTWTGNAFADATSPDAQRFFNYLCIAVGGAPKSFEFLVTPKENEEAILPQRRAERCPGEYEQVRMAFNLRIMPFVDADILVRLRAVQWLQPNELR